MRTALPVEKDEHDCIREEALEARLKEMGLLGGEGNSHAGVQDYMHALDTKMTGAHTLYLSIYTPVQE